MRLLRAFLYNTFYDRCAEPVEWQAANIYTQNTHSTQYSFINKALGVKPNTLYHNKHRPNFPMSSISFYSLDTEKSVLAERETISKQVTLIKVNVVCHL